MQEREKVAKSRNMMFFQCFVAPGGRKSRLAKALGAEASGRMRDKKLRAVAARSTCPSQNDKAHQFSDHFWELKCRKHAHHCGARHVSKSKRAKHRSAGTCLEAET